MVGWISDPLALAEPAIRRRAMGAHRPQAAVLRATPAAGAGRFVEHRSPGRSGMPPPGARRLRATAFGATPARSEAQPAAQREHEAARLELAAQTQQ